MREMRGSQIASSVSFNILVERLTLRNFSAEEIAALYAQHTADTGQVFISEALEYAFTLSQGQPWLVNALARQAVEVIAPDPATPITAAIIDEAQEFLIQRKSIQKAALQ
jgi:hypothetical protein